jgi:hypothetical protein
MRWEERPKTSPSARVASALRPHLGRAPVGEGAVVHGEAVVVLGHGNHIAEAGGLEERRPSPGVELLGLEHRDEVLVAELGLRTIGGEVVRELLLALLVHVPGIPLVAECGHGVDAPVDEDPELGVLVPPRGLELREGGPARSEGPARRHRVHLAHLLGDSWILGSGEAGGPGQREQQKGDPDSVPDAPHLDPPFARSRSRPAPRSANSGIVTGKRP